MVSPLDVPDTDIISDLDQDISYTSFNKVASILEDNKELQYTYDVRQDRIKSVLTDNNTSEVTTKYYFNNYEIKITPSNQSYKIHYIHGTDGLCAIVTMDDNNGTQVHYTYNDHLGSIQTVTDDGGTIEFKQSFDAWGRRRDPDDWNQIFPTLGAIMGQPEWLYRGFTGHEHVPEFGLINMNGRMYDPALGRMCSPDKYVQAPLNTQSYNRYAYCLNNPLKYTDPSGDRWWHWALAETMTGGALSITFAATSTFVVASASTALLHFSSTNSTPFSSSFQSFGAGFIQSMRTGDGFTNSIREGNNRRRNSWRIWGGQLNGNPRQIASRHSWETFQNGIGLQYSLFSNQIFNGVRVGYFDGATTLTYDDFPGGNGSAVTIGSYINGGNELEPRVGNQLFMHEYGHYLQSQHSGPLYLYKYGLPSLFTDTPLGFNNGTGFSHDDFWVEQDANERGFQHFNNRGGFVGWNNTQFPRAADGELRNVQWYEPFLFLVNPILITRYNRNN